MQNRIKLERVQPAAYKVLTALDAYNSTTQTLQPGHKELMKIRASQINGCAYCVNYHCRDARKLGETEHRIFLLPVWRESNGIFSETEQLLLEMTEQVTLIHNGGLSDQCYDQAVFLLGDQGAADALMLIITINAWNRVGVSLKMHPSM